MKISFFVLLGLISMASVCQAQSDDDYVIAPRDKKTIEQDSSAHHRIGKNYQLTAILTGIGPSLSGTGGLQGAIFLDRNRLIVLEATSGSLSSQVKLSTDTSGSTYDITTKSFGAHYKHITGNSFYYRLGADYRTVDYKYTFKFMNSVPDTRSFKGTSIAANLQIGNQWQWENFTLGCDWVGLALPLTSQISDEAIVSTDPTYDRRRMTEDQDQLVKNSHITFLRFYLGASF